MKSVSEGRADSTGKREMLSRAGKTHPHQPLGDGREFHRELRPSSDCHNPKSYTKLGEEQPGREEEQGGILSSKHAFHVFSVLSNPFEFSLS